MLCADDFGFSTAGCRSILELGAAGAISATSCAVDGPATEPHVAQLRSLRPHVAVGLHLNLTENPAFAGNRSLPRWLLAGYLRIGLASSALRIEIDRQLQRFESLFGAPPDFIDGHEHVHQLPVIRELLVDAMQRRYADRVALRCTRAAAARGAKAGVIEWLGSGRLKELAARRGLFTNSDFAGVYNLSGNSSFAQHMETWLRTLSDGGLIMCHPELQTDGAGDTRGREHHFLASAAWPELQRRCGVSLVPFRSPAVRAASRAGLHAG